MNRLDILLDDEVALTFTRVAKHAGDVHLACGCPPADAGDPIFAVVPRAKRGDGFTEVDRATTRQCHQHGLEWLLERVAEG